MELKPARCTPKAGKGELLIVPYGIETVEHTHDRQRGRLLIVPYGIETCILYKDKRFIHAFNCTLWN